MTPGERWMLIGILLIVEVVFFMIPVGTFFAIYILLARPVWFRDWVLRLYAGESS